MSEIHCQKRVNRHVQWPHLHQPGLPVCQNARGKVPEAQGGRPAGKWVGGWPLLPRVLPGLLPGVVWSTVCRLQEGTSRIHALSGLLFTPNVCGKGQIGLRCSVIHAPALMFDQSCHSAPACQGHSGSQTQPAKVQRCVAAASLGEHPHGTDLSLYEAFLSAAGCALVWVVVQGHQPAGGHKRRQSSAFLGSVSSIYTCTQP